MKKKIFLLCISILFSILEIYAYSDITINGITYSITEISSYGDIGKAVVKKGPNYSSVEIPDTIIYPRMYQNDAKCVVEGISSNAFAESDRLVSIHLPPHLTKIGTKSFYKCSKLTTINLDSIYQIDSRAFDECISLSSVKLGAKTHYIYSYAFNNCTAIESITIPADCEYITNDIFFQCSKLKEINVSLENKHGYLSIDGILYQNDIYNNGFISLMIYPAGLENNKYITPDNVSSIGSFSGNKHLKTIYLSDNVQISGGCILNCTNLEKFELSAGNSEYILIDGFLIRKSEYQLIAVPNLVSTKKIPDYVRRIASGAYSGCTVLTDITIPKEVYDIATGTFSFCPNLRNISLYYKSAKKNLYEIFGYHNCSYDTNYGTSWGDIFEDYNCYDYSVQSSHYECYSPRNVGITLEDEELSNIKIDLKGLKLITFNAPNLKDISNITSAIWNLNGIAENINIGSAETIPERIFQGFKNLKQIVIPFPGAGNKTSAKNLGTLFGTTDNKDDFKTVIQFFENGKKATYNVPATLEKITIAEGCEEIQYGALYNFSMIREITLPSSLYMVGENAFYGCAGLTDIYNKGASPAAAFENSFTGVRTATCKLHVPQNSKPLYERSTGWKDFYYIQEESPVKINVAKNIENAGIILGLEEYQTNDEAKLEAYAHSGYRFTAWTENGEVVNNDYIYSFTVTSDRNLIAIFVPIPNDNDVDVSTSENNINFTWEQEEGSDRYTLTIYSDAKMTEVVKKTSFDANGNVMNRTTTRSNTFRYTINDLPDSGTYYYNLTAYTVASTILSQRTGSFIASTTGIYETDTMNINCYVVNGELHVDNVYGLPIMLYTPQGILVAVCKEAALKEIFYPEKGMYIVRIQDKSWKVYVQR